MFEIKEFWDNDFGGGKHLYFISWGWIHKVEQSDKAEPNLWYFKRQRAIDEFARRDLVLGEAE